MVQVITTENVSQFNADYIGYSILQNHLGGMQQKDEIDKTKKEQSITEW